MAISCRWRITYAMQVCAALDFLLAVTFIVIPFLLPLQDVVEHKTPESRPSWLGVGLYWYFSHLDCGDAPDICEMFGEPGWPRSLLRPPSVTCAYLANNDFDDNPHAIALCLTSRLQAYLKVIAAIVFGVGQLALTFTAYQGYRSARLSMQSSKISTWRWFHRAGIGAALLMLTVLISHSALTTGLAATLTEDLGVHTYTARQSYAGLGLGIGVIHLLSSRSLLFWLVNWRLQVAWNAERYVDRVCSVARAKRRRLFEGPILSAHSRALTMGRRSTLRTLTQQLTRMGISRVPHEGATLDEDLIKLFASGSESIGNVSESESTD